MRARHKLIVWVAVAYGALLAVGGALLALLAAGLPQAERAEFWARVSDQGPALAFAALVLLAASAGAAKWLFDAYPGALRALAEQTGVVLGANAALEVGTAGAREVAEAAAAINRLAGAHRALRRDFELRAKQAGARLEEERNRLAALMAELSEGVLVCNPEGRILLYNERARLLFAADRTEGAAGLVGLGRSLFALVDRDQIVHALEKIERAGEPGGAPPTTRFVTATAAGRLLKVTAAPFGGPAGALAGLVLTLEDVTALADQEAARRRLLQALAADLRAQAANIRAAAENLAAYPDMDPERRERFVEIVAAESQGLSQQLDAALAEYAGALKAQLLTENLRATDLIEVACQRIAAALGVRAELDAVDEELWLRVDSFAFVQALSFLAARLRDRYAVRELGFAARAAGGHAELDLQWAGAALEGDALALWEDEPMQVGSQETPLTLRDVLDRHGAEAWYRAPGSSPGGRAGIRFLWPAGEPVAPSARPAAAPADSRPEYYDFDLFRASDATRALQERRLAELVYTAFDTETTGLEPSAGDEIIGIGAVRIVNRRLLKGEVYEQLVNPRRALGRESAAIHGIGAEVLRGQPAIAQVLPGFHRFCEDSVLIAHNAAFDMRFLQLKEASSGVSFTQPVLDTLLLSAAVHPGHADHRLEAIAARLGVRVVGRHTALGDALLTAEIFLKLLPLLAERGIATLGEALAASRETYYARLQY